MADVKAPIKDALAASTGVGVAQVYLLGIVIVLGGQYTLWNTGLAAGFYSFLFCTLFLGVGYVCLSLCLSEMIGILPFGGGAYGFARLTLGPTFGYLIGCCESIESILYVAAALIPFGKLITSVSGASSSLEPLWWFLFYVSAIVIHLSGSRAFWSFTNLMGVTVLAVVLMYCLGTIPDWDYPQFVASPEHRIVEDRSTVVNTYNMMTSLPLAGWWFVGIEGLPLACSRARDAVKTVPRAIMLCMGTALLSAVALLFCCAAQSPGVILLSQATETNLFLLSQGFHGLFRVSHRLAGILSVPALYSTAFGFTFIYGTQISAMAKSGLFPKILANSWGTEQAPHVALIAGSLIGFLILIVLHYSSEPSLVNHLFNVSMLGSFFVYVSTFTSFVIFRAKYTTLTRNFVNPLGVYSAYVGIFVFCVAFVAIAVFQNDNHGALGAFVVLIGFFVLYYYCVAKKRQYYSPDEQGILLVTYIIKGNKTRKKRRGSAKGPLTPQITRSNQNTPTPHGRDISVPSDQNSPTPKGVLLHADLKEEDGVVPFAVDETLEEEDEDPDPAPPPSMAVSTKPGANRSIRQAGVSVKPSSKLSRGDTYDQLEGLDKLGELASFENYSNDAFDQGELSVRTQIQHMSANHNRAMENWERAKGHVVSKKAPARLSNLIHKRMHNHPPPVALNMRSSESHHSNFSFRSTSSHYSFRSHRSSFGYSKYSPSRANHHDPDDGDQHRERGHAPEADEASFRTGRRGSDQSTVGFSVRAPPMQARNFSHWFSHRQVAPESSWYLSMRSSHSSSTTSSASRRIIATINRSISSVNGRVDDIVSAHHDALVENIMNVLPKKDAPNFDRIVEAIVRRMLLEREVDDDAMDAFLESLGETDEALVIALRYREELAKRATVGDEKSRKEYVEN